MALPNDDIPIGRDFITYFTELFNSNGATNPDRVRAVVVLFDDGPPRSYPRPGMGLVEPLGPAPLNVIEPAKNLVRIDHLACVVYEKNPTCSWVIVNGVHKRYCG